MKTQIIQLEPHDDSLSTRDKMGWARASRLILVLPERNKVFQNKLEQELILRHAQKIGAQIAFVTNDRLTKTYAKELSIPTFHTITKATKSEWKNPDSFIFKDQHSLQVHEKYSESTQKIKQLRNSSKPWTNTFIARLFIFSLGVLAVLTLAATLLPSAQITIHPDPIQQKMTFYLTAKPQLEKIRITGEIPITQQTIRVQGEKSRKTTGIITIPLSIAEGEVLLTNLTDHEVDIPLGTIVTTINAPIHRYQITRLGSIPAGAGKTLTLPIKALVAGSSENIPANTIQSIEGALGLEVSAANPANIKGGTDQSAPAVSKVDQEDLFSDLKTELIQQAFQQLSISTGKDDLLLDKDPINISYIRSVFSPALNEPSDTVKLELEIEATFALGSGNNILQLANQLMNANIPKDFQPANTSIQTQCLNAIQKNENNSYSCKMEISRQIIPAIDLEEIQRQVLLQPIHLARQRIQSIYPFQQPVEILMTPSWWNFLPALPMQIAIQTVL